MQPTSVVAIATGRPARGHRTIEPINGYVHKFRLEACEEAASPAVVASTAQSAPTVVELVAKLALSGLALSALLIAGARALVN